MKIIFSLVSIVETIKTGVKGKIQRLIAAKISTRNADKVLLYFRKTV